MPASPIRSGAAGAAPQACPQRNSRGLFAASPADAQETYAPQIYPQPVAQPATRPSAPSTGNRGLFTSRSRAPAYQPQPGYAVQPAPQYGAGGPYVAAPQPYAAAPTQAYASAPSNYRPGYTLDSGDKLRIVVFGQEGITNSYTVGVDGNVNLPLIGSVPARGFTTQQLSGMISERLKQGYVREPHVSVEVEAYRPFFILGEVTTPGQYPYVANMTAETAIAIAGGFSRAPTSAPSKSRATRPASQFKGSVPLNYPLRPGDTVVVKERWF